MTLKRKRLKKKKPPPLGETTQESLELFRQAGVDVSVYQTICEYMSVSEQYRLAVSSGQDVSVPLESLLSMGHKFRAHEKLYKLLLGGVLTDFKLTMSEESFRHTCKEILKLTLQTANTYATIYEAWISGRFLYSLPNDPETGKPYNFFDLGIRDLEFGAQMIIQGELDEDNVHVLFSDGSWLDKRDTIKDNSPALEHRNSTRRGSQDEPEVSKPQFYVGTDGDMMYGSARVGFLNMNSPDPLVSVIASRAKEALFKEFKHG